jgi:uncharacterized protein YjlB
MAGRRAGATASFPITTTTRPRTRCSRSSLVGHAWFSADQGGREVEIETGDVLVLPAGTGHCLVEADAGFEIIGAYPAGQDWDICRDAPDEAMLRRIAEVPYPASDPLEGQDGALPKLWSRT